MSDRKYEKVLDAIKKELKAQNDKWGVNTYLNAVWLPILIEEIGEVGKAVEDEIFKNSDPSNLTEELIQVAAVAVQWLADIYERTSTNAH